jgi:asparaginyl-tRNA synthetase
MASEPIRDKMPQVMSGDDEQPTITHTPDARIELFDLFAQADFYADRPITVWGRITDAQHHKKRSFVRICDSWTDSLQIVFDYDKFASTAEIKKLQLHWTAEFKGIFTKSPSAGQQYELICTSFKLFGKVDDQGTYPLAKTTLTMEHLRKHPQIECRSKQKSVIYGLRAVLKRVIDDLLYKRRYIETQMPTTTYSECEGGCALFTLTTLTDKKISDIPQKDGFVDFSRDFHGSKASLTGSAQLELESHLSLGRVYTWTKAFRAELSMTTKHLAEFTMLEIERLCESAKSIMDDTEYLVKGSVSYMLEYYRKELEYLTTLPDFETELISKLEKTVRELFIRITHAKCIEILKQQPEGFFREQPEYDGDLASEHERFLVDVYFKHAVFVMRYPKKIKSFYMPVVTETPEESRGVEHVDSFDLLIPGLGELVGGSARIYEADKLRQRISECGIDPKPLQFYIDMSEKASFPHGGMGLGFERLVKYVTGAPSVRDCVAYPSYVGVAKQEL